MGSSSGAPGFIDGSDVDDAAYGIIITGLSPAPDSGDDASQEADARVGVTGSVIEPDGGNEAGPCGGVCGIIVHPDGG